MADEKDEVPESVRPQGDAGRMSDDLSEKASQHAPSPAGMTDRNEGSHHANTPVGVNYRTLEEVSADELHLELKARSQRNRRIRFSRPRDLQTRPLAALMSVDRDAAGAPVPQKLDDDEA